VVTRTGGTGAFDVHFATSDGTATTADGDYVAETGTVHFNAGDTSEVVSVQVNGDTKVEPNENFHVTLSGATNGATISRAEGTSIIVNDDAAPAAAGSVAIGDAQIVEGNSGSQLENFVVTRTGGTGAFDVHFATSDGTATTADGDYVAKTGTVHFAAGVNSQIVSVQVNGDTKVEPNENFHVNLSGATNGATISHGQGTGTIVNDDAAPAAAGSVAIGDAQIVEGNSGSQLENFVVTRTGGTGAFDVHFATSDGTATTADGDYVAKTGTVHFAAGVNSQIVSVQVNGDTKVEPNENFHVNLSGATNGATISHAQGTGTIVNDDASPTHTGGSFLDDVARAIAKAVGDGSPTHSGNILTDGLNAFAHAVATGAGDGSSTHTGNLFGDGLAAAAHAIANDLGTAGAHGGSFWDQAAAAIHLFTGSGGVAPHGAVNASGPMLTQQAPAADLHSTGLAGMLSDIANHLADGGHNDGPSAPVTQENHAYPHFELPTLHPEFQLHHS
jgi:hypothetical protein